MEKNKDNISLLDFYQDNSDKYLIGPIHKTIEDIISDFKKKHPEMFNPTSNNLVVVESIQEALNNLDLNWEDKYKNHVELFFYNQGEPINNLMDFYQINKDYYDSLKINYTEVVNSMITSWQEFSGDTMLNTGYFHNQSLDLERRIIFIKESQLKDYLADVDTFDHKIFGDKLSNTFLTFIYQKDDPEFSSDNLNKMIKHNKERKYGKI